MKNFIENCSGLIAEIWPDGNKRWEIFCDSLENAKEISRYLQANHYDCSAIYHNDCGDFSIYVQF